MKAGGIIVRQVGSTVSLHSKFTSQKLLLELGQNRQVVVLARQLQKPGLAWRPVTEWLLELHLGI